MVKAKFFKIKNVDGDLYAKVEILTKTTTYSGLMTYPFLFPIESSRINEYSKDHLLYVGDEQSISNRDSLYVAKNKERSWKDGHIGYFDLDDEDVYNILTPEEKLEYGLDDSYFRKPLKPFPVIKYIDENTIFRVIPTTLDISQICKTPSKDIMKLYKLRLKYSDKIEEYLSKSELIQNR